MPVPGSDFPRSSPQRVDVGPWRPPGARDRPAHTGQIEASEIGTGEIGPRKVVQHAVQQRFRKPFHVLDAKSTAYHACHVIGRVAGGAAAVVGEVEVEGVPVTIEL
jgi:hypothetical protein